MLKVGDTVPDLALPGDDGATHALRELAGEKLVVYFYPRDNTPGCTREAIAFTKLAKDFERAGVKVVGVSRDSVASHCGFRDKQKLGILLLSDTDLAAHEAFGAWGTKVMYGKKVEGVLRSTFAFDAGGKATHVWPSVKVDGHAEAVLEAVRGRGAEGPRGRGATGAGRSGAKKAPAKKAAIGAKKKTSSKRAGAKKGAGKKK